MTETQAGFVYARINAIWPTNREVTPEEIDEWLRFLRPLNADLSELAIEELRGTRTFRPSMADFLAAYKIAAAQPEDGRPALPAGDQDPNAPTLLDLYGSNRDEWVYCWKCDMAVTLEELSTNPHYRQGRGLHHRRCPKSGSAPIIPQHLRIEREEHRQREQARREARRREDEFGGAL